MSSKIDDFLRFHEVALSIREQRQQLLASNIANADTPNYKARDIDFSLAMQSALNKSGTQPPGVLAKTSSGHLDTSGTVAGSQALYRNTAQGNIDGNTVDMDVERNQFTDNSVRYEASLTMINMQIRNMLSVLQG